MITEARTHSEKPAERNGQGKTDRHAIELGPRTVDAAGRALFALWLKIAATLVAAKLITLIWPVLVLILISLMFVATFNPLVRRLQARWSRGRAVTTVVVGSVAAIAGILTLMIPPLVRQGGNVMAHLPTYLKKIEEMARQVGLKIHLDPRHFDLARQTEHLGPQALGMLTTLFSGITGALTVAVLTIYLLIDGPRVATGVIGLLPRHQRLLARQMFGEIGGQIGDYMRGQLITSGLAGVFSYVLLRSLGVDEPLALAFLMAVSDAIPFVGPLVGTVPAVLMAMTQGSSTALLVLAGYVIYHQMESHILVPRVYGATMKLSPSVIVIAILIGATLMGILGAILALPVAAAVPVIWRYLQEWRDRDEDHAEKTEGVSTT